MFLKRITDFFISFFALCAFAPVMILVAIAIKLDSAGPIIFKQKRVGLKGQLFEIYKFQTIGPRGPPFFA